MSCCLCEKNEWDAMNAEPEEQMKGSGQVIRVVNYTESFGEGHSAGPKAAVNLSVDTKLLITQLLCSFFLPHTMFKLYIVIVLVFFPVHTGFYFFYFFKEVGVTCCLVCAVT